METGIIKLAFATIPAVALIGSAIFFSALAKLPTHRHLSFHRIRSSAQRALAAGAILR
ncbi:hypothetical protein [Geobacter sp. FeAm09]|uniref:hypothetical protein n=1 Tax=Geobacter sp. FeAm09 TaxID=2597769 RepID=UPI00143D9AEB|nr:hypothetical protein [Geobacter sp. FeAm09]